MVGGADKTIVRVIACVQRSHSVEFAKHDCGQKMIYGKRIGGMAVKNFLEFLHRPVIVHVVEVIEGGRAEWIGGTVKHGVLRVRIAGPRRLRGAATCERK